MIGDRAENLVWIFSLLRPRALFDGDVTQALTLPLTDGGETFVRAKDRRALIAMFWANSLEQQPFEPVEEGNPAAIHALIERTRPVLTDTAIAELQTAYEWKSHNA
jgi:hypothetical protein